MLAWAWDVLWWLAWYALACGGWIAGGFAQHRANRLDRELTFLASRLRYPAWQREKTPHG